MNFGVLKIGGVVDIPSKLKAKGKKQKKFKSEFKTYCINNAT